METVLFIPGVQSPYSEDRYAMEAIGVAWEQNEFGLRNLSGTIVNNSKLHLDWIRVEFILYSTQGLPVGMTSDCQFSFSETSRWIFKAPVSQLEATKASQPLLSCEYGRITRPVCNNPAFDASTARGALMHSR